jgi:hypothetical protein
VIVQWCTIAEDPFRIGDVPSYGDLRDIEDWNRDRDRKVANGFTESDLLQYSIDKQMYSSADIGAKFSDPSENTEIGIELMEGPDGGLKLTQMLFSIFAGSVTGALTGDSMAGFAAGLGTYIAIEGATRSSGYFFAKGRDRQDIRNNPDSPYNEEMEEALKELEP